MLDPGDASSPDRQHEIGSRPAARIGHRASLTPLLGRDRELDQLAALIETRSDRLITILGPGGIGKTRIARELAERLLATYPDGCWFVPLAPLTDATLVPAVVATAVGIRAHSERSVPDLLGEVLRDRTTLLVLDNMEHLLGDQPSWLVDLLMVCPRLTVVVTSRSALKLSGERRFVVGPLPVPAAGEAPTVESAALALFLQRARAVRPDLQPDDADLAAIAEICRHLDGLPLAIELAAARLTILSPRELLARLPASLALLSGADRSVPARQRSLRATLAWSHDLLPTAEQKLLARLSVFAGGFTLVAALDVGRDPEQARDEVGLIDSLSSLVDQSLITRVPSAGSDSRFEMLETIRQFASDQLDRSGASVEARDRHATWCLVTSQRCWPHWLTPSQRRAASQLAEEQGNLRAALAWLVERGDRRRFVDLATSLWMFWFVRGDFAEGRRWLERAREWTDGETSVHRMRALMGSHGLAWSQGDRDFVTTLEPEMHALWGQIDMVGVDSPAIPLALAARHRGDDVEAMRIYEAEVADLLPRAATDPAAGGLAGLALSNMANIALDAGDAERARSLATQALQFHRSTGFLWGVAEALEKLAMVAERLGDRQEATLRYREMLATAIEDGDPSQIVEPIGGLAVLALATGQDLLAALLLGKAGQMDELLGRVPEARFSESELRDVRNARERAGAGAFDAASTRGRSLALDGLLAEIDAAEATVDPAPALGPRLGITAREMEVLRLVASGMTNQQIGDALFISTRTVTTHVMHLLEKLDTTSRSGAVARAFELGLLFTDADRGERHRP